jgi:hypothetical protein
MHKENIVPIATYRTFRRKSVTMFVLQASEVGHTSNKLRTKNVYQAPGTKRAGWRWK